MAQYISKSDLVAEINKRIIDAPIDCRGHQRVWAYNDVKDILNTLEVKEMDFENELQQHIKDCLNIKFPTTDIKTIAKDVEYTARKFFELGLKAQKGE